MEVWQPGMPFVQLFRVRVSEINKRLYSCFVVVFVTVVLVK